MRAKAVMPNRDPVVHNAFGIVHEGAVDELTARRAIEVEKSHRVDDGAM